MFHVYVDPIFGDNGTAWELNPGNPLDPTLATFARWPGAPRPRPLASDGEYIAYNPDFPLRGHLQHAPLSFRTLSRENGALEYVYSLFDDPSSSSGPVLPWVNPDNQASVTHVVIHCLPGLYGPKNPQVLSDLEIDSRTGLAWNDEQFPIQLGRRPHNFYHPHGLYDRVSIQGTSALDTIFDARGKDQSMPAALRSNTVFQVWGQNFGGPPGTTHEEAFIDGVAIRDALVDGPYPGIHGIGIHLVGNTGRIGIAITNCFIYGCAAGVVLDAHGYLNQAADIWGQHHPILANNTILADCVAVWGGQLTTATPPATGLYANNHSPLLINNILSGGDSAFEGIHDGCFLLDKVDDLPLSPAMDFNAFDSRFRANGSAPAYLSWVSATTGMATGTSVVPRVDLSSAANYFVTNLLAGIGVADHGHDLRLSPCVSDTGAHAPGSMVPLRLNPLIAAGVNLATDRGNPGHALRNVIGTGFDNHPGLPIGVEEAPVGGWDYDCEGFGNSRIKPRDGPMVNAPFGTIDIGADQCGRLIMAGYVPLTRMFVGSMPTTGSTANDRIFFVDEPNKPGLPRPLNNWVLGGDLWFANVQTPPAFEPTSPYGGFPRTFFTPGLLGTVRRIMYDQGYEGPSPGNLACDFAPALLSDPRLWSYALNAVGGAGFDVYSCNPFYHAYWALAVNPFAFYLDNPCLFHNRHHPTGHALTTWQITVPPVDYRNKRTWVTDAHLNAPGSLYDQVQDANWLNSAAGFFGPWSVCGGPTYATGLWGLNDACPDDLPPLALDLGIRINCEVPRSLSPFQTNTNLQSFLVVPNGGGAPLMAGLSSSSVSSRTQQAVAESRLLGLSIAQMLNIPGYLGTEMDYRSYVEAVGAVTRARQ